MSKEVKPGRMGRPKVYEEPRQRLTLELPRELVSTLDRVAGETQGGTRTWVIQRAVSEWLAAHGY